MALLKVVVLCGLVAVCSAQLAPVLKAVDPEYDPNPQYQFAYSVQDPLTGDAKSQEESRDGDFVKGSYSLVEPDGALRTVQYTADPVNGFNAVVSRALGAAPAAPVAVKAVAPAPAPAAPVVVKAAPAPAYKPVYYNNPAYAYQPYRYSGYPYSGYPYSAYPYSGYPYSAYPYRY
ncbi:hypothetical protein J6590_036902 [Homalodisca vitripennis]|nr:hypothetical protein J6590_036902 [Homalodisca vitripennis]